MPYKCGGITATFYSNSCDSYVAVELDDIPYAISIKPHPTCKNYETYDVQFEVREDSIITLTPLCSDCFVPSDWKTQIANEVNEYLSNELDQRVDLKNKLIQQELELCLV
jgi:hypothetical protein